MKNTDRKEKNLVTPTTSYWWLKNCWWFLVVSPTILTLIFEKDCVMLIIESIIINNFVWLINIYWFQLDSLTVLLLTIIEGFLSIIFDNIIFDIVANNSCRKCAFDHQQMLFQYDYQSTCWASNVSTMFLSTDITSNMLPHFDHLCSLKLLKDIVIRPTWALFLKECIFVNLIFNYTFAHKIITHIFQKK